MKVFRFGWIAIFFLFTNAACARASEPDVRESILAGAWYKNTKAELTEQVSGFLDKVPDSPKDANRVTALIVPHAGYTWSGPTAAYAFKALKGASYNRVVVLAPSHHIAFQGGSIANVKAYQTPIGNIPLDTEACQSLLQSELFSHNAEAHAREHSLEIQLPFLQYLLGDFKLVPVVVGQITQGDCEKMAKLLRPMLDSKTLLVISSDFIHQGPRFRYQPYKENIKTNIRRLDFTAVNHILNQDVHGLWSFFDATKATICGRNPIKIGLMALPLQTKVEFVHYATSGDATNDYSETVSYCAMVFREEPKYLNREEFDCLLHIARQTLVDSFEAGKALEYILPDDKVTQRLKDKKGVFVTLKKQGRLRGCIGHMQSPEPLYRNVSQTVLSSAFGDHRFNQLTQEELKDVTIEISVMSPQREIESWKQIVLGRDGIIIEKNGKSSVYLPQVALEQGWDIETTLNHLSEKAGLKTDDWKEGCKFTTFTAQVFGEGYKTLTKEEQ